MNIVHLEDYLLKLRQQLIIRHYLFCNGKREKITAGENWLMGNCFHINFNYMNMKDDFLLMKLSISNLTDQKVQLKLFVENYLHKIHNNYVFISPKKDVLFLTNHEGLFLTSGLIGGSSISQYGVLKRKNYLNEICDGMIPFYPIGSGDVIGLFTLEKQLAPYETTVAYTWTLASKSFSEKDLLQWDEHLKTRLAFS